MRKTLTRHTIAAGLIICLSLVGLVWAVGNGPGLRVETVSSESLDATDTEIIEINRRPHLKYSVANKSGKSVPAVAVTLTAFDAKGRLRSRQTWVTRTDLAGGARTSSILAVTAGLKSASRVVAEFAEASVAQEGQACTESYCTQCTSSAEKLCGAGPGKVKDYSCTVGSSCSCSFTCGGSAPEESNK